MKELYHLQDARKRMYDTFRFISSHFFIYIIFYNSFSKHIKFGVLTPQEIVELAEIEVCNRELYNVATRAPVKFGCLDRRLV